MTNIKDIGAGLCFIAIAALFAIGASGLRLGTSFQMGPGYFPLVLAGLLGVIGIATLVNGLRTRGRLDGTVPWRACLLVLGAPILFGLAVRPLGMPIATFLVGLLGAFGAARTTPLAGLAIATGLTLVCYLVFIVGLDLNLPIRPSLFEP